MIIVCAIFASTFVAENLWDLHVSFIILLISYPEEVLGIDWLYINIIDSCKFFCSHFVFCFAATDKFNAMQEAFFYA